MLKVTTNIRCCSRYYYFSLLSVVASLGVSSLGLQLLRPGSQYAETSSAALPVLLPGEGPPAGSGLCCRGEQWWPAGQRPVPSSPPGHLLLLQQTHKEVGRGAGWGCDFTSSSSQGNCTAGWGSSPGKLLEIKGVRLLCSLLKYQGFFYDYWLWSKKWTINYIYFLVCHIIYTIIAWLIIVNIYC